ncbi:MAG: T9SS type A sorting domain-containing protein, partial [Bacteroidota bacterium]
NSCQQFITFSLATSYAIKFPRDVIGDCIDPGADTLVINNYGCDQFAVNSVDEEYDVTDGACFKILRTYNVINWCEYDGFSDAVELNRNAGCLEEPGSQDLWVIRAANGTSYLDADEDQNNNIPAAGTRPTSCDGQSNPAGYWANVQSNGKWSYTQVIKVVNTTAPVVTVEPYEAFCINPNTCEAPVSLSFNISGLCAAATAVVSAAVDLSTTGQFTTINNLDGSFPNFAYNDALPVGNHRLRVEVEDDCSGLVATFIDFQVVDCNAAGLLCNNTVSLSLMQQPPGVDADGDGDFDTGAIAVNVNLFVNATGEDCTGPLRFTIHRTSDIVEGLDIPFPNHPALVVTCDDIGFIPVMVYAWDSAFNPDAVQPDGTIGGPNYTTCDAFLQVLDDNNVCSPAPGLGSIAGLIITEEGLPVQGVEVSPRDDMPEDMMMTENDGLYHFDLETEQAYQVTPYSPDDYLNGVSTLDLILISKHILGVEHIASPYKIIAADINRSNTVSTLDLVHLRKAILGITADFPNNESWRFINDAFEFPDPLDPWLEPFPETVVVPMLMNPINSADFIAIKIGDINGNAQASLLDEGEGRASGNTYYLRTEETDFAKGEKLEATFTPADDRDEIQGFQFTLQFDPAVLAVEDIEWGAMEAEHVNTAMLERGLLAISWNEKPSFTALNFFTIRFEAIADGRLSESIGITSRLLNAEAYGLDDSRREMALNFSPKATVVEDFFLEQNKPNPFGDQTIIGFQIPNSGQVTLTIYDTHGKVVQQYQKYYAAGYNQLLVDAQDINARGLLYYKLETDHYAATKKMVILE